MPNKVLCFLKRFVKHSIKPPFYGQRSGFLADKLLSAGELKLLYFRILRKENRRLRIFSQWFAPSYKKNKYSGIRQKSVIRLRNLKGFTLIELLIVISVVGVLAGSVLVYAGDSRKKARDSRRKNDIAQITKALELYYLDNNSYPESKGANKPGNTWNNSNDDSWKDFQAALMPYLRVPVDPVNSESGWAGDSGKYTYAYSSKGNGCSRQWYILVYRLEKSDMVGPGVTTCNNKYFNYPGTISIGKCAACK